MADEIAALMAVARHEFPAEKAGGTICGPEFAESGHLGGADADLIVDGCLWDVKTTINPTDRLLRSIRQLLGYVLLDWGNEFRMERAGFYFARQGTRMCWPLDRLIEEATGEPNATLAGLRGNFRLMAERAKPAKRR